MKIINKTLKKLSQTMMLSFLLAPIYISSTQACADSVGGRTNARASREVKTTGKR